MAEPPTEREPRPLVLAITGASGAPYAVRLLSVACAAGWNVHLSVSPSGAEVLREELGIEFSLTNPNLAALGASGSGRVHYYHYTDFHAPIASGSAATAGMVICPCSMSTLAAVAHGLTTNLITRAADVHLKERRKLVVVPRETPLSLIHLEAMAAVTRAGGVVLPAMPGWYHRPRTTDDLIDFVVARICDQMGVPHNLSRRWGDGDGR